MRVTGVSLCLFIAASTLAGCNHDRSAEPRLPNAHAVGNPEHGAELIAYFGCGGCHEINGVPGAVGQVGPPLDTFARRVYIAGMLRNTPDNLVRWIRDPQAVVPGNVMPRLGVDNGDARDIAAYLYTRK